MSDLEVAAQLTAGESDMPGDSTEVDDRFLLAGVLGGDASALRQLMDRYDRLVRYTVFHRARSRARSDPQWVDSVASATWAGFVQSLRRRPDNLLQSVPKYLVRIARNSAVSELRKTAGDREHLSLGSEGEANLISSPSENPSVEMEKLELLETLRGCIAQLGPEDQRMSCQLDAITDRRWRQAAEALGIKESTLRSRWKKVLETLGRCVERKIGKFFAL